MISADLIALSLDAVNITTGLSAQDWKSIILIIINSIVIALNIFIFIDVTRRW